MPLASAANLKVSITEVMIVIKLTGCLCKTMFPRNIREISNKSSISWVWSLAFRSMVSKAWAVPWESNLRVCRSFVQPKIGFKGDRNSWDKTVRNSSLIRLVISACSRAACSLIKSCSRSCSTRLRSLTSKNAPITPRISPASSRNGTARP